MPIEIKEIIIRATIGEAASGASSSGSTGTAPGGNSAGPEALQECIEQVFQIMDDKNER